MLRTRLPLAAALLSILAMPSFADPDADFAASLRPALGLAADSRYKLIEKKAAQTLDMLKTLRGYARDVKQAGERLKDAMLDDRYEDWVNTKLLGALFEAASEAETLDKTYDLEKGNVKRDLAAARSGDYGPIEQGLARIAGFQAEHEARVKANEGRVARVRSEYEHHLGTAKAALAAFEKLPLIQELLAAKPRLIKEIRLAPASLRPLVWRIELIKERGDYNDPRYGLVPASISVPDGDGTAGYRVVVR